MDLLDIYRNGVLYVSIKPSDNSVQTKQIMGDNVLNLSFDLNHYVGFSLGDYCIVFGEMYSLREMPVVTKVSTFDYNYKMVLRSDAADLVKCQYLTVDATNNLTDSEFSVMGNAKTFMDLLLTNLNRVVPGWQLGEVIQTDYQNISFSKDNCSSALAKIATAFKTEWWVEGQTLYLTAKSKDSGYKFQHGKNRGLYEILRQNVDNSGIITRMYGFGSDKNLPANYYSKRLRFPGGIVPCLISNLMATLQDNGDDTTTYTFSFTLPSAPNITGLYIYYKKTGQPANPFQLPLFGGMHSPRIVILPTGSYDFWFQTRGGTCGNVATLPLTINANTLTPLLVASPIPFIEKNVNLYGVIEQTLIYEDIIPSRTGKVTAIDAATVYTFIDDSMDFDINEQLLPGLTPKVTFNTGQLAGFTFDIQRYDPIIKEFTLLKNKMDTTIDVPSPNFKPVIGDTYVITDINMPVSYLQTAEKILLDRAQKDLDKYASPQVSYSVSLDPKFIKRNNIHLNLGDTVYIQDTELEINKKIRITQLTRNIVNENQIQIQLSDTVQAGALTQIINVQQSNASNLQALSNQFQNNTLLNGEVVGDLKFTKGTAILPDMPETVDISNFQQVYIEKTTGKLYRKA
jgi:hypothetical protein